MVVPSSPTSPTTVISFPDPVLTGGTSTGALPTEFWNGHQVDDLFGMPLGEFSIPPGAPLRREDSAVDDGELIRVLAQEFEVMQQGVRNLSSLFENAARRVHTTSANLRSVHVRCTRCKINRVPFYNRDDENPRCYDCDGHLRNELKNLKTSLQF